MIVEAIVEILSLIFIEILGTLFLYTGILLIKLVSFSKKPIRDLIKNDYKDSIIPHLIGIGSWIAAIYWLFF